MSEHLPSPGDVESPLADERFPSRFPDPIDEPMVSAFVPILIMGLSLIAWFAFQVTQLRIERDAMRGVIATQEKSVQESKKLRESLDAIARGTARLADDGNANAKRIVDELKKRGITISQDQPAPGTSGTPATPATPR